MTAAPQELPQKQWPMEAEVLADAFDQTRPYNGDREASDHAWSARLDAAVHGMDVVDAAGLDVWMGSHAAAGEPHLLEAELVAAWESHIRAYCAAEVPAHSNQTIQTSESAGLVDEQVADDGAWEL